MNVKLFLAPFLSFNLNLVSMVRNMEVHKFGRGKIICLARSLIKQIHHPGQVKLTGRDRNRQNEDGALNQNVLE